MKTVSMHQAKTHLSRLVKEEFVITNNGRPVARVSPIVQQTVNRFGFLPDDVISEMSVPDDFDTMGSDVISDMFVSGE